MKEEKVEERHGVRNAGKGARNGGDCENSVM